MDMGRVQSNTAAHIFLEVISLNLLGIHMFIGFVVCYNNKWHTNSHIIILFLLVSNLMLGRRSRFFFVCLLFDFGQTSRLHNPMAIFHFHIYHHQQLLCYMLQISVLLLIWLSLRATIYLVVWYGVWPRLCCVLLPVPITLLHE